MKGCKLFPVWLLFPCLVLACDESRSVTADSGALDISLSKEAAAGDLISSPDNKTLMDQTMLMDKKVLPMDQATPPPDQAAPPPDSEFNPDTAAGDAGACQKNGQSCLTNKCCSGLQCCTGMPIPPGKAVCYVSCPVSDRALKYGVRPLSSEQVLQRLTRLPVSTWTYNNEPPGVRHIGPMAQDFNAAFGVGADPRFISPVDADGVAFVALQALHKQLQQLRQELRGIKQENQFLRGEILRLGQALPVCRQ